MTTTETKSLELASNLSGRIAALKPILKESPPLLNQIAMLEENLAAARAYLEDPSHALAFIGAVGVGKTTAICHLLGLVNEDGEALLSTSSGRTTLCEVEIKSSNRAAITVDPLSEDEVHAYLFEFIDSIDQRQTGSASSERESVGLSSEFERAIRNMIGLTVKRNRRPDGKVESRDDAHELLKELGSANAFLDEAIKRLDLPNRTIVELICEEEPQFWIKEQFARINHGRAANVPMPRRIIIEVPWKLCDQSDLDIRVIDTKGLDGNVEREDLDNQLKSPRTAAFVCSRFNDAPEQSVQALLLHMIETGLSTQMEKETGLLVLDREEEASKVMAEDGTVQDAEDGRLIREEQMQDTLRSRLRISTEAMPRILFHNVGKDDSSNTRECMLQVIREMRLLRCTEILEVDHAVKQIEENRQEVEAQAAMKTVGDAIQAWVSVAKDRIAHIQNLYKPVVDDMASREVNAGSLRASMNRKGKWDNFDVYYKLALAARKKTVTAFQESTDEIILVLHNLERQQALAPARPFMKQLLRTVEEKVQSINETASILARQQLEPPLIEDDRFWQGQKSQWGQGPGYKGRVAKSTEIWFQQHDRTEQDSILTSTVTQKWKALVKSIEAMTGSHVG